MAVLDAISHWSVPALALFIVTWGLAARVPVYEAFVRGARSGLAVGLRLVPYLVAVLSVTHLLQESGAMQAWVDLAGPLSEEVGIPASVLPMALLRPLSGSAATGFLAFVLERYGPDSLAGRMASVMHGSTETTLYVVTVYLGSVGIRDARWALAAGLLADAAGILAAAAAAHLFWGAH